MVPMLGAVAVDGWISHRDAGNTATVVQDRLLLGSARIIAEQLHVEDGAFQDHVPPAALELFESGEIDRVYYRVTTGAGQIVTGYAELALPAVRSSRRRRSSSTRWCAARRCAQWLTCSPCWPTRPCGRCWWKSGRP